MIVFDSQVNRIVERDASRRILRRGLRCSLSNRARWSE
jgi:hypothetical protein